MKCKKCNNDHAGAFGKGIFCSRKCACSYAGLKTDRKKQSDAAKKSGVVLRLIEFNKNREDEKRAKKELERLSKEHFCESCGNKHDGLFGSGRFCSSFCSHKRKWTDEQRKNHSNIARNSEKVKISNKKRIKNKTTRKCLVCEMEMLLHPYETKKYCSRKCSDEGLRLGYFKTGSGGCREGSGRGKCGWYKGIQCDSSYELAWVIYNLEHSIAFERNKLGFEYEYEGKNHKYYPDFYLINEKKYIEIKGFITKQNDAKIKSFKEDLIVLYKNDLVKIFKYVIDKYGKNFIELYEGNPHKKKNNNCILCGKPSVNIYCSRACAMKSNRDKNINRKKSIENDINQLRLFSQ